MEKHQTSAGLPWKEVGEYDTIPGIPEVKGCSPLAALAVEPLDSIRVCQDGRS